MTDYQHIAALRRAAVELGHQEPISIEPDGTIWLGDDDDRVYLTDAQLTAVNNKATQIRNAATAAAASGRAKLAALGLTDDEINALLGA